MTSVRDATVADIMDTEEQEDQKIRMSARDALDKVSGISKVCSITTSVWVDVCTKWYSDPSNKSDNG